MSGRQARQVMGRCQVPPVFFTSPTCTNKTTGMGRQAGVRQVAGRYGLEECVVQRDLLRLIHLQAAVVVGTDRQGALPGKQAGTAALSSAWLRCVCLPAPAAKAGSHGRAGEGQKPQQTRVAHSTQQPA